MNEFLTFKGGAVGGEKPHVLSEAELYEFFLGNSQRNNSPWRIATQKRQYKKLLIPALGTQLLSILKTNNMVKVRNLPLKASFFKKISRIFV